MRSMNKLVYRFDIMQDTEKHQLTEIFERKLSKTKHELQLKGYNETNVQKRINFSFRMQL